MENTSPIIKLVEDLEKHVKTNLTLYKLTTVLKSANIVSGLVSKLILLVVIVFFMLMLSIGASLWAGEIIGSAYKGFLVVSGFYILLFIILYLLRTQLLITPARNVVVSEMLKKDHDEE